jgi:predicted transposase YbfD/YdcC
MERTKRHLLIDMAAIALCAAICGAEGWADVERFGKKKEWFARFLDLPNGIPSHDTFGRVFARLDTSEFYACLQRWIRSLNTAISDHGVRLDGKTLRHSFDTAAGKDALHLLNAWSSDLQVCLGQLAVDEGSNEITAVPKLLDLLELTGAVVTLDAMHCQKETAQGEWADLKTIGMVYRERELNGTDSHEVVFFISSLPPSVQRLAKHLRGHWGIENSLHWSLDVTCGEDKSRIRVGSAPEIAAGFRRLALSILKRDTSVKKCSIRGKRL